MYASWHRYVGGITTLAVLWAGFICTCNSPAAIAVQSQAVAALHACCQVNHGGSNEQCCPAGHPPVRQVDCQHSQTDRFVQVADALVHGPEIAWACAVLDGVAGSGFAYSKPSTEQVINRPAAQTLLRQHCALIC